MSVHLVYSSSHRTTTAIDASALLEMLRFLELGHALAGRLDQLDCKMYTAGRLEIDLVLVETISLMRTIIKNTFSL